MKRLLGPAAIVAVLAGCGSKIDETPRGEDIAPGGLTYTLSIGPMHVEAGTESTQCVVVKLPSTQKIHVGSIHDRLSSASHHLIVYRTSDTEEQTTPFKCKPFASTLDPEQGAPLAITQKQDDAIVLPPGVAYTFEPGQLFRLELHYINATPAAVDVQATSTFETVSDEGYAHEAELVFIGSPDILVPAHSKATLGPTYFPMPADLGTPSFFAITGHEHQLGTNVTVTTTDGPSGADTSVYDVPGWTWNEPALVTFDPPFRVPEGGGFRFTCDWNNTTGQDVKFGESATAEMCFFWAYYYPSQGARVCFTSKKYHVNACCPGSPLCSIISAGFLGHGGDGGRPADDAATGDDAAADGGEDASTDGSEDASTDGSEDASTDGRAD